MNNTVRNVSIIVIGLLFFFSNAAQALNDGIRFGFGAKAGLATELFPSFVSNPFRSLGFELSCGNSAHQIELDFSPWFLPAGTYFDEYSPDQNIIPFSLTYNWLHEVDDSSRGFWGLGFSGIYHDRAGNKTIDHLSPAVRVGGEFGTYKGINFSLEVGLPLLFGVSVKEYLF